MPSLQSSSGTATPDPELATFADLCFEAPYGLDDPATAPVSALQPLQADAHGPP